MNGGPIRIKALGVRGSAPITGKKFEVYGGATTCICVQVDETCILLDGGTGLFSIREHVSMQEKNFSVLVSHPHLDHLSGLLVAPICFEPDANVSIYVAPRGGRSSREQVEAMMTPPLWPVDVSAFTAHVSFHDMTAAPFFIGEVRIDTMEGSHPGGCTVFRLTYQRVSVVYATDFEQDRGQDERLCRFAQGCDLFLCDGQYTGDELMAKRGFGHSSWEFAAQMGRRCGAKKTWIIHHDIHRTDEELRGAEEALCRHYTGCAFARAGEECVL